MFFFFNDTATTEIYTLSLHDALPIFEDDPHYARVLLGLARDQGFKGLVAQRGAVGDRKSTRLNSSHGYISYAVFCLKKKITHPRLPGDRNHETDHTSAFSRHRNARFH